MNNNFTLINGLAALPTGFTPPNMVMVRRDPTPTDWQNFIIGSFWLNQTNETLWVLVSLAGNIATWVMLTGGSGVVTNLTGNTGGLVTPLAGNINVVGDGTTVLVAGNPGTHTLTISVIGGEAANSFPTDAGTATPVAGVLNVFGGTSGRDINTSGSGNTIHIDLKNAITLGDLSVITTGNDAITVTSGNITLSATGTNAAGNINMPASTSSGEGVITYATRRFIHTDAVSNQFIGLDAGNFTLTGVNNLTFGAGSLSSLTTGSANIAIGNNIMVNATTSSNNCIIGSAAYNLGTGTGNTLIGDLSLGLATTATNNTCIGTNAGYAAGGPSGLLTGTFNTIIGMNAGSSFTSSESNNILIGESIGTVGDNTTLRIGNTGVGTPLTKAFCQGIRGVTTGNADAIAVLIDSAGQLGTVSSSLRFKENIIDMVHHSADILKLRPVLFNYKQNTPEQKSVGLIAEEVKQVIPSLVVNDETGQPLSIKYHDLPVMLLNELQKAVKQIAELQQKVDALLNKP